MSTLAPLKVASLKVWLEHCDKHHKCCLGPRNNEFNKQELPSRLLNVRPSKDDNQIRLDISLSIKNKAQARKYIALSYCWGQEPGNKPSLWCTELGNLEERCNGFTLNSLPKTLIDAVQVARQLGVQYLWIDSLCIVQRGDDGKDWKEESKRMEAVFASAYCTIAATAADHSRSGFLGKKETATGTSTKIADFDIDLSKALLNTRAWVMQERYLSPRTIHFCANRIYAECGEGIYAEDNIFLQR